jgi:Flp pilus assembly protein TadD
LPATNTITAEQSAAYDSAALQARQRPSDPDLALQAGSLAGNSGQYRAALEWFQRAEKLKPNLLPAITGQGQMWAELGRPGMAAEQYERALKLAPDEPQLHLELARAYSRLRDFDPALKYALKARDETPSDPQVYRALANIAAELEQRDNSIQYITRACELGAADAENWATKGALLLRYGRYPQAEKALKEALRLNPAHVAANIFYARTLIEGRKTAQSDREAFAALARARLVEPRNAEALLHQGQILIRQDQVNLGISLLQLAREGSPRDPRILLALGQALIRGGRGEEGVLLVNQSQQLGPRAVSFVDLENLARQNPSPALADRLASLYQRQELFDSAIWVLQRALKRTPGDARLEAHLREIKREVSRREAPSL